MGTREPLNHRNYVGRAEPARDREITAFRARWGGADADAKFVDHCQTLFARYNARYFASRLMPVAIRIGDGHQTVPQVGYSYHGRYLAGRRRGRGSTESAIELDYGLATHPRKLELVLLHEMLHHYEHGVRRDPACACPELERPIAEPPYLGAALELAFLLVGDRDVRRWIATELRLRCGPDDDRRIQFYLRGHSHRFIVAAYNLARLQRRADCWHFV